MLHDGTLEKQKAEVRETETEGGAVAVVRARDTKAKATRQAKFDNTDHRSGRGQIWEFNDCS